MEKLSLDVILNQLGVSTENIEGAEMTPISDRPDRDVGH